MCYSFEHWALLHTLLHLVAESESERNVILLLAGFVLGLFFLLHVIKETDKQIKYS